MSFRSFFPGPAVRVPKASGFLRRCLKLRDTGEEYFVRNVPGDGACCFHAIASAMAFARSGRHPAFSAIAPLSKELRQLAVEILQSNSSLYLDNGEQMSAEGILDMVASHYNTTPSAYCQALLKPNTWAGGPEIAALSTHYKVPIHVYRLAHTSNALMDRQYCLEMHVGFGSPVFDTTAPLEMLIADSEFEQVVPGEQEDPGTHFFALFPCVPHRRPMLGEQAHESSMTEIGKAESGKGRMSLRGSSWWRMPFKWMGGAHRTTPHDSRGADTGTG